MQFSFDFVWYTPHLDIVRLEQGGTSVLARK